MEKLSIKPFGVSKNWIQIRQAPTASESEIFQQYKMRAIPHYIVIDKEGNMRVNNGPRPPQTCKLMVSLRPTVLMIDFNQ